MLSSFFKYLREFSSSKYLRQQQSQVHFFSSVCQEQEINIVFQGVEGVASTTKKYFRIPETDEKTLFEHVHSN